MVAAPDTMNNVRDTQNQQPAPAPKQRYAGRNIGADGQFEYQGYAFQVTELSQFHSTALYRFAGQKPQSKTEFLIEELAADRTGTGTRLTCKIIGAAPKTDVSTAKSAAPGRKAFHIPASGEFKHDGVTYRVVERLVLSTSRPYVFDMRRNLPYVAEVRNGQISDHTLLCEVVEEPATQQIVDPPKPTVRPVSQLTARPEQETLKQAETIHPVKPQVTADSEPQTISAPKLSVPEGAFYLGEDGLFSQGERRFRVSVIDLQQLELGLPFVYRSPQRGEQNVHVIEQLTGEGLRQNPPRFAFAEEVLTPALAHVPLWRQLWHQAVTTMKKALNISDEDAVELITNLSKETVKKRMEAAHIALAKGRSLQVTEKGLVIPIQRKNRWAVELILHGDPSEQPDVRKKQMKTAVNNLLVYVKQHTGDAGAARVRTMLDSRGIKWVEHYYKGAHGERRWMCAVHYKQADHAAGLLAIIPDN